MIAVCLTIAAGPLAAQETHEPIIPNVIAPDAQGALISVTVERGLTSSKRLRSQALRKARSALHEGEPVSEEDLRALSLAGDGLAAQRYVRVLKAGKAAADPSDIAYFSAVAVGTGRIWTIKTMIAAMHELDPATEPRARIRKYINVLYPHAWAGNQPALDAVVAFNGEGRLFGPLSESTRSRILAQSQENGDGRIELGMAVRLLERVRASGAPADETLTGGDLAQAHALLKRAEASMHLGVSTSAQNFLRLMDMSETAQN